MRRLFAALVSLFLALPALAQAPAGFAVHDANNVVLGTLSETDGVPIGNGSGVATVIFQGGNFIAGTGYFILATGIGRTGFATIPQVDINEGIPLYYLAANCTGTGYMSSAGLPAFAYAVSPNGGPVASATIWAPGPPFVNETALSVYGGVGLGVEATCQNGTFPGQFGVPTPFTWTVIPNLGLTALQ